MNEEDFKNRMEQRWRNRPDRVAGRRWAGVFILAIGGLLFARASGVAFPAWFFTGPVLLMAIGLFLLVRHRFRNLFGLIPLGIGGLLLIDRLSPSITLRPYIWPIVLIVVGLAFIFRPKNRHCRRGSGPDDNFNADQKGAISDTSNDWHNPISDSADTVDITAVFSGVKKNMISKNFRGGDVVSVMGGTELNLTQSDFKGRVVIDSFNMFGGTKLIVPPDWDVQSQIVAIFGGVDDKRPPAANPASDKVLILDGTCIFGGVEIKSY